MSSTPTAAILHPSASSTDLLRLNEVGHLAVVVGAAHVEAGAGTLRAEAGDDAGLGLFVAGVDGPDLHAAAHQPQQPVLAVDAVVLQVQVKRLVPIG